MRHVILTCVNHPELRWSCKEIAWSGMYNGSRHLFFSGTVKRNDDGSPLMFNDLSGVECNRGVECQCDMSDLTLAPEDENVKRH